MVQECPVCIEIEEDIEVLDAKIIRETEATNHFTISSCSATEIILVFEYIESKDGILLQIIHSGSANSIKVKCKIKGGEMIRCLDLPSPQKTVRIMTFFRSVLEEFAPLLIVCTIHLLITFNLLPLIIQYIQLDSALLVIIVLLAIIATPVMLIYVRVNSLLKTASRKNIPEKLLQGKEEDHHV